MIALRLICAAVPYRLGGLLFGAPPTRAYGVIQRPLDQFGQDDLRQLFTDPRIDVSVGVQHELGDWAFIPVTDELDLARVVQMIEEAQPEQPESLPRGTAEILADHARMEAEQARDAAAPGGDDETQPDTTAAPVAGAAPPEAAPGETADGGAADAPGASAATEMTPESEAGGVAGSVAPASPAPVAGGADGETAGDQAAPSAEAPAPPNAKPAGGKKR